MPLWPPTFTPGPLITPVKRGQSRVTTLTESVYPTEKPNSSYHQGQPTIGGSVGGFIGLVVGLGVLAIITSVAAFILIRRRRNARGVTGSGFPKTSGLGGIFGRKKSKGWMETQSYADHNDDDIPLPPKGAATGRVYDDPFNAESLDNLQRETSVQIDHGPQYHPVSTSGDGDKPPTASRTSLQSGTKFHEGL